MFVGFLVVLSTGIDTPLEFLFSSFLVVVVKGFGRLVDPTLVMPLCVV